ncbi:hypothetical protein PVAG01_06339 [Phlyctema vagabunda]|uniref:Uncharacterized protein n=1 Tax=Phlyctema vagabunda TaxID=108571 RepID=A0ABR4PFX2_9HELO
MTSVAVSQDELAAFHTTHFSSTSTEHFTKQFLGPVEDEYYDEEDDGLGYYEDGVKRTLTDEQITMFRHSEIQALLREQRHTLENKEDEVKEGAQTNDLKVGEMEDEGEITEEVPAPKNKPKQNKNRSRQPGQGKSFYKQHIKPDLRKRTWDKVETGLSDLSYDEESGSIKAQSSAPQRRRISYED